VAGVALEAPVVGVALEAPVVGVALEALVVADVAFDVVALDAGVGAEGSLGRVPLPLRWLMATPRSGPRRASR
jgi:hypothetical protein